MDSPGEAGERRYWLALGAIVGGASALIAVGTEVTIDTFKLLVGLKRKVTSLEALERMEHYLPGQLADLNVSAASREQFRRLTREMRQTLALTLQGAEDLAAIRAQIAEGEFGDAFRRVEVAADALQSELDVSASVNLATDPDKPNAFRFDSSENTYRVGVAFDGPLNRFNERNAYRASQIAYQRARRDYRPDKLAGVADSVRWRA